ncbi:hypothetical protein LQ329_11115 [Stenotrophomonas maltophilia]|uniref:hypothetical protein n=1 Tax=Stenotrophomonas maltophilia TaxID=40324 RepID=UPI001E2CD790|nr:hypothetical protein [Stenotrophomonas maltophilia]UGB11500.1 hypothetical protein LQ329_11115 [Stenotrophomonas maltophilia]
MSNKKSSRIQPIFKNCFNGNNFILSKQLSVTIVLGVTIVVSIALALTLGAGALVICALM